MITDNQVLSTGIERLTMNFQNLQYFLVTCEELNITKAAERLHVSQQALSNLIGRMEEELGCRLFIRKPDFELTYSGKCFRESAVKMIDLQNQTRAVLEDISNRRRGELRLGISHTRGQAILPYLLPAYSKKHPGVQIRIVEGVTRMLEESLEKGTVDVLIGFLPFMLESAETVELMKERMYILVPGSLLKEHFGDRAKDVCDSYRKNADLGSFRDFPFILLNKGDRIREMVDIEFYKAGISPEIKAETPNIQTTVSLAAEGMGIAVCPELYLNNPYTISGRDDFRIKDKLEIMPFISEHVHTIGIGYNRERYLSNAARDFIDLCIDEFRSGRIVGRKSVLV